MKGEGYEQKHVFLSSSVSLWISWKLISAVFEEHLFIYTF